MLKPCLYRRLARAACLLPLLVGMAACGPRARTFDVKGRVAGFADDARTVFIDHEAIPGFMPAMTMPLKAADASEIAGLGVEDAIRFTLHVSRESTWISGVARLPDSAVARREAAPAAGHGAQPVLTPGEAVPAFELTDQDGRALDNRDYRGRLWLVTFIYTRCPLPDYCPLLSSRFAALQKAWAAQASPPAQLLSISFDAAYDTPAVLKAYAGRYGADPARWRFAVGSPETIRMLTQAFGVTLSANGQIIDHNLTTALIDRQGRIVRLWRDNDWAPEDVLKEVALYAPSPGAP